VSVSGEILLSVDSQPSNRICNLHLWDVIVKRPRKLPVTSPSPSRLSTPG
jgi:hypothetical protein